MAGRGGAGVSRRRSDILLRVCARRAAAGRDAEIVRTGPRRRCRFKNNNNTKYARTPPPPLMPCRVPGRRCIRGTPAAGPTLRAGAPGEPEPRARVRGSVVVVVAGGGENDSYRRAHAKPSGRSRYF